MNVAVVGAGHVGLPTAAVLAHIGHRVGVSDSDPEKIAVLVRGELPFHEPQLAELVSDETRSGRLSFTSTQEAVADAEVAFLCVGTPPRATGEANIAAVEKATEDIGRAATGEIVIVQKSTVPTGTASRVTEILTEVCAHDFAVVSNPEFLRQGSAVGDALRPSRIVVGSDTDRGFQVMRTLFEPLRAEGVQWIECDIATAELAKHASNAFLALKISFANALARLCERAGADVVAIAEIMGSDPRIGPAFLDAGLGYGGYCFPKDLAAFERLAADLGYDFPLLREIARINAQSVDAVSSKVQDELGELKDKRVALLGLAYKPGTDDVRLSPALELAESLLRAGAAVIGYDPVAAANAKTEVSALEVTDDLETALNGADCAVVCTEWPEVRALDPRAARRIMRGPVLIDARNAMDGAAVVAAGLSYVPVGRPVQRP